MRLSVALIDEASAYLAGHLPPTPLVLSPSLSDRAGVPVWLKLETHQVTGSFKVRGALFHLSRLDPEARDAGVVTCSAGNHGKGVAWAGRTLGVPVTVHVPSTVDAAKHAGMVRLGATVVVSAHPGYDDAELVARADAAARDLPFLSAFDDPHVMAGNGGSLGAEVLAELPAPGTVVVPVSGGGLAGGLAHLLAHRSPSTRLVAVQHADSPALALSLERGEAITRMPPIDTVAGGLEGGIGASTFAELRDRVGHIAQVTEARIQAAFAWFLQEHQILAEPSSTAAVAALLDGTAGPLTGPVVVVMTGRNVSLDTTRRILCAQPSS